MPIFVLLSYNNTDIINIVKCITFRIMKIAIYLYVYVVCTNNFLIQEMKTTAIGLGVQKQAPTGKGLGGTG